MRPNVTAIIAASHKLIPIRKSVMVFRAAANDLCQKVFPPRMQMLNFQRGECFLTDRDNVLLVLPLVRFVLLLPTG